MSDNFSRLRSRRKVPIVLLVIFQEFFVLFSIFITFLTKKNIFASNHSFFFLVIIDIHFCIASDAKLHFAASSKSVNHKLFLKFKEL